MSTKKPITEEQQDWVQAVAADVEQMAALQHQYNDERDLVNQLLGQAQMADAFAKFSVTVTTSKLEYVKETKIYRALKGKKSRHGDGILNGTWEEFCRELGRSVEMVDRDIANLRAFGEEALESMSRMGIGYRELRQFRRLPADEKAALIEAAKAGDKEAFEDFAEELVANHTKKTEELAQKLAAAEADKEATSQLLAKKDEKINELETELTRRTRPTPSVELMERQEQERNAHDTLRQACNNMLLATQRFHVAIHSVSELGHIHASIPDEVNNALHFVYQQIASISQEMGMPVSFEDVVNPSWAQPYQAQEDA